MPWCPNCKTEYREGITHCTDCKAALVDSLDLKEPEIPDFTSLLVQMEGEQKESAKKLVDFLEYSGIPANLAEDAEGMIAVYTTPEAFKDAKRRFRAFCSVEAERALEKAAEDAFLSGEETAEDENSDGFSAEETDYGEPEDFAQEPAETVRGREKDYISSASRYSDYRSSGFTFTIFGVFGITFALLNIFNVIPLFHIFSSAVVLIMSIAFLIMGIFSFVRAKKLKEEADKEETLVSEVKKWLEENITADTLRAYDEKTGADNADVKDPEILYLNRLDCLCETLLAAFPELNASHAEQLIEDFYGAHFD